MASNKNGLVVDQDKLWGAIADAATTFSGTLKQGHAHASTVAITVSGENKAPTPISDEFIIRFYSQCISAASTLGQHNFEDLANKLTEDVTTGVSAAGTHDTIKLADVLVGLVSKIAGASSTHPKQGHGRFKIDTGLKLDKDPDPDDAHDKDISAAMATLSFSGRFYLTDDDGDARFALSAELKSGQVAAPKAELTVDKSGVFTSTGPVVVYHGPGLEHTKEDALKAKKDPSGVKAATYNWYKYDINLALPNDAPVVGSEWPFYIDVDVDAYADTDTPTGWGDNSAIVTVEELLLTIKPKH